MQINWSLLVGYDLFISYKRSEASAYAARLETLLREADFRCFLDNNDASPGEPLTHRIRSALRRSKVLVVLVSPQIAASDWVAQEIGIFSETRRDIIPINLSGSLRRAFTLGGAFAILQERNLLWLEEEALGEPSSTVLGGLQKAFRHRRANRNLRLVAALVALVLTTAGGIAYRQMLVARQQRDLAQRETRVAKAQALAAQSNEFRSEEPQLSLLLAAEAAKTTVSHHEAVVVAAEQALRDSLASVGGVVLRGHTGPVTEAALSDDSHWAITASQDKTARIWNLQATDPAAKSAVLAGHSDEIGYLAITGDSRFAITGSSDHTVRIWDLPPPASGRARFVLPIEDGLHDLSASRDGRWIAALTSTGVRLWDLKGADRREPKAFGIEDRSVDRLVLTPDSRWLVTGHLDGVTKLWALPPTSTWVPSKVYDTHLDANINDRPISALTVSDDSRWLLTGTEGGTIRVWELADSPQKPPLVELTQEGIPWHDGDFRILSLAVNSETGRFSGVQRNGNVRVLAIGQDKSVKKVRSLQETWETGCSAMSSDGKLLMVGGEHGDIRLLSLDDEGAEADGILLKGHESFVNSIAFSRDNKWAISGSSDDTARLWRMEPVMPAAQPISLKGVATGSQNPLTVVAMSPDLSALLAGGEVEDLRVFDLTPVSPESLRRLFPEIRLEPVGLLSALAFSGDGQWFAAGDQLGHIVLRNIIQTQGSTTIAQITHLELPSSHSTDALALSKDHRLVAAGSRDGTLQFWNLTNSESIQHPHELGNDRGLRALAISLNDRWLVAGGETVVVHDLSIKNSPEIEISPRSPNLDAAQAVFSDDGKKLAVAFGQVPGTTTFIGNHKLPSEGAVKVWDINSQGIATAPTVLHVSGASLTSAAISHEGHWIVAGGYDGNLRVWDLSLGSETAQPILLRGGHAPVLAVGVAPDERTVASYSEDGILRLWKLQFDEIYELARRYSGRNLSLSEWNAFQPGQEWDLTFPEFGPPQEK